MIYIIGGPPRAGKTTLAGLLLRRRAIPFVSTDVLFHSIIGAFPETGITDGLGLDIKAERFFPFLKNFCRYTRLTVSDYAIEGDAFAPSHIAALRKEGLVKACFLGFSEIGLEAIKRHAGMNDWLDDLTEWGQARLPAWIIERSSLTAEACRIHNLAYFDMSRGFDEQMERAYRYLTEP